jgi:hypothetical protein
LSLLWRGLWHQSLPFAFFNPSAISKIFADAADAATHEAAIAAFAKSWRREQKKAPGVPGISK